MNSYLNKLVDHAKYGDGFTFGHARFIRVNAKGIRYVIVYDMFGGKLFAMRSKILSLKQLRLKLYSLDSDAQAII